MTLSDVSRHLVRVYLWHSMISRFSLLNPGFVASCVFCPLFNIMEKAVLRIPRAIAPKAAPAYQIKVTQLVVKKLFHCLDRFVKVFLFEGVVHFHNHQRQSAKNPTIDRRQKLRFLQRLVVGHAEDIPGRLPDFVAEMIIRATFYNVEADSTICEGRKIEIGISRQEKSRVYWTAETKDTLTFDIVLAKS